MRLFPVTLLIILCLPIVVYSQEMALDKKQITADSLLLKKAINRADSLFRSGETNKAISLLEKLTRRTDSLTNNHLIQSINIKLIEDYLITDQFEPAKTIIRSMLDRYPESENYPYFRSLLGVFYEHQGEYEKALDEQLKAKSLVDSVQSPVIYSKINLSLARTYESTGNFGAAFNHYLRSIEGAEELGDSLFLATGLNSLGVAYNDYENYKQAKYYLEQAQTINQKIDNKLGLLHVLNNLAITHKELGDIDIAISFYNDALSLHKEVRNDVPPFRILYNLGQLNKDIGNLEKAEKYYQQSLAYSQKVGLKQGLIHNYGGLANVAELRDNYPKAKDYYTRALNFAREIGTQSLTKNALFSLSNLEEQTGNFEEALSFYKVHSALSDSLDEQAREQEIADVETRLGLRQQEEMNRLLQEKQAQQEARIVTQNWLIGLSVLIIAVIFISTVILYQSNRERKRINKELEELNEVKNKMMGVIAHDLRSPMASMQGILYLLRENNLSPEEIQEMTSQLEVSIGNNISMMDNLLVWARDQMSGLAINTEVISARELVEQVIGNLKLQADRKGIKMVNKINNDIRVNADRNLLQLILRNLISNSIKFSHDGGQIVIIAREKSDDIFLEVQDSGIGIPRNVQENIFDTYTESRSGTNNEKGSGLGLRLCKEFVEKQGGDIDVESTEGEGSTFYVSLTKG